jgi:hypothetical protein
VQKAVRELKPKRPPVCWLTPLEKRSSPMNKNDFKAGRWSTTLVKRIFRKSRKELIISHVTAYPRPPNEQGKTFAFDDLQDKWQKGKEWLSFFSLE